MNEEFQLYLAKWEDYLLVKVLLSKQLLDLATLKEIYQESHSTANQDVKLGRLLLKKRLIKDMDYVKAMASVREYAKSLYENKNQQLQQEILKIKHIMQEGSQENQKTVMINQSYDEDNQDNATALNNVVQSQNNDGQTNIVQKDANQDDSHHGQNQNEPSYPDKKFSSYEIIEEIARGGMGIVYKARQLNLNRIVALKVLLTGGVATPTEIKRFRQEAEIAGSLQHPYIVSIYEVGEYNHYHYFTMDYIPGDTLKVHIKKHSRKKNLFKILVKISEALQYAHDHNVIHRDIKPSNIIVTPEWEPKLTDFGLAKRINEKSDIPEEGHTLGTPFYLSPEQARGDKNIDGRTDIYSMGVILYEILTGQVPFRSNTLMELYNRIMNEDPLPPRRINKRIDKNISTICLKAMSKEPEERYQTAQELADDLSRYLKGEPIVARPTSQLKRIVQYVKKNSQKVIKNSIILLCLTIITIGIILLCRDTSNFLYKYDSYETLEKIHIELLKIKDDQGKNKQKSSTRKDQNDFDRLKKMLPEENIKQKLFPSNYSKVKHQYIVSRNIIYGLICLKFHQYAEATSTYETLKNYDEAYGYYGLGMIALEKYNLTSQNIKEALFCFDSAISIAEKSNRMLWNAYMQRSVLKSNSDNASDNSDLTKAMQQKIALQKNIKDKILELESQNTVAKNQNKQKEPNSESIDEILTLLNEILWNYSESESADGEEMLLCRAKVYRIAKNYKRAVRDIMFCDEIASFQNKSDIQKEKELLWEAYNNDKDKDIQTKESLKNSMEQIKPKKK